VDLVEHPPCVIEPLEQRAMAALFFRRLQLVLAGDVARMLPKPVRSEDFAPDGGDKLLLAFTGTTKQREKPSGVRKSPRRYNRRGV